ncbi:Small RNA degrading nuclease 5 [Asimina triloba]
MVGQLDLATTREGRKRPMLQERMTQQETISEFCQEGTVESQEEFLKLVHKETVLIGHSLENDLLALKISHCLVIDTAVLYKHHRGAAYKTALRILAKKFLSQEIQAGNGHDSIEDARAAMDLALLKIRNGPDFGSPPSFMRKKLVSVLSDCGRTCSFIDDASIVKRYAAGSCHAFPVSHDDEALSKARKEVKNGKASFIWIQFSELHTFFKKQAEDKDRLSGQVAEMISLLTCQKKSATKKHNKCRITSELEDILTRIDGRIRSLYADLPTNTMLIACTGHGNTPTVQRTNLVEILFLCENLDPNFDLIITNSQALLFISRTGLLSNTPTLQKENCEDSSLPVEDTSLSRFKELDSVLGSKFLDGYSVFSEAGMQFFSSKDVTQQLMVSLDTWKT